jgi:hypothetical protein
MTKKHMVVIEGEGEEENNNNSNHGLLKSLTRDFLKQRYTNVMVEPSVKKRDPLTLSTIWYRLRPKFRKAGIEFKKTTRRTVEYDYIRTICEDELGVKRADLGIHTAVRAQLYYRGEIHDIALDNVEELAEKGVDLIIIEKEGVAEVIAPFAAMTGIAILNTRGFLTEIAETISELVKDKLGGSNIATLHDFDASGVAISKKAEGIVSLGVDPTLLEELEIDINTVQEEYNGEKGGHWLWLKKNYPKYKYLDYLKDKRVEIDSVIAEVGAEKLWAAMRSRLLKKFPTRDYRRAIMVEDVIEEYTYPTLVNEFAAMTVRLIERVTASCNKQIREEYSKVKGFIEDVFDEEKKIATWQLSECEKDETIDEFNARLRGITNWLRAKEDEEDNKGNE